MHGMTPFTGTELDAVIRNLGVSTIVLMGVSLNLGIIGAALSALDHGYQVVIVRDAVIGLPRSTPKRCSEPNSDDRHHRHRGRADQTRGVSATCMPSRRPATVFVFSGTVGPGRFGPLFPCEVAARPRRPAWALTSEITRCVPLEQLPGGMAMSTMLRTHKPGLHLSICAEQIDRAPAVAAWGRPTA